MSDFDDGPRYSERLGRFHFSVKGEQIEKEIQDADLRFESMGIRGGILTGRQLDYQTLLRAVESHRKLQVRLRR